MKIIADENIPYAEEAFSTIGDVTLIAGRSIDEAAVHDADLLFVRSITKVNETLLKNSRLNFAATATIGTDHIDQKYLKKRGTGFAYATGLQCKFSQRICALRNLGTQPKIFF